MTTEEFNKIANTQIDACRSILGVKHEEYTLDNADRLDYFKRAAILEKASPKSALLGMLAKHLISISDMCASEKNYSKARWEEKITDSINYLILLRALVEEENGQNTNKNP